MKLDFSNLNVLLIGDFMVDSYIDGKSSRISPEAPVPVISSSKIDYFPGGAGNVAMNLNSLGAKVSCLGYIGNDKYGEILKRIFRSEGIDFKQLELSEFPTTVKERYFSNFITQVENSGLFKKIDVINKKTTSGMDIDNMTFELKCEL